MYLSGGKAGILNKFDDIQRMTMKVMCALIFAGYIILQYCWNFDWNCLEQTLGQNCFANRNTSKYLPFKPLLEY